MAELSRSVSRVGSRGPILISLAETRIEFAFPCLNLCVFYPPNSLRLSGKATIWRSLPERAGSQCNAIVDDIAFLSYCPATNDVESINLVLINLISINLELIEINNALNLNLLSRLLGRLSRYSSVGGSIAQWLDGWLISIQIYSMMDIYGSWTTPQWPARLLIWWLTGSLIRWLLRSGYSSMSIYHLARCSSNYAQFDWLLDCWLELIHTAWQPIYSLTTNIQLDWELGYKPNTFC